MRCQHCILVQHKSRETTEYQSNFVIVTCYMLHVTLVLGTVTAMAIGCVFLPAVLVLLVRLKRSGSPILKRPHCDECRKQLVEECI